jgi:hypothetical protein
VSASLDVTTVKTLPDHERCDTHRHYKLSCAQYEQLIARADHRCEICRRGQLGRKLFIDHDGALWSVRGLLCNTSLRSGNRFSRAASDYLDNAWWIQQCHAIGVPVKPLGSQPPVGSAFRNQWGVVWIHTRQDHWHAPMQPGRGSTGPFWETLYRAYGPQNLAPVDLPLALTDGSLPRQVEYALRSAAGADWPNLRILLGLPEPAPRKRAREWSARGSLPWLETPEKTVHALRAFLTPDECLRIAELLVEGA